MKGTIETRFNRDPIVLWDGKFVASCKSMEIARLVAAAPALLAACKAFSTTYDNVDPDPNKWPDLHLAVADAEKAIASVEAS